MQKNYPMIHEFLTTAAQSTQPAPKSAGRPAQTSAATPKAETPAVRVELSAFAKARAREAAKNAEKSDAPAHSGTGTKFSDPKVKQILWSQKLWQQNPSGVANAATSKKRVTIKPFRAARPATSRSNRTASRRDVPTRSTRGQSRPDTPKSAYNRRKLQAYKAAQDKKPAATPTTSTAKTATKSAEAVGVKRTVRSAARGVRVANAHGKSRSVRV